ILSSVLFCCFLCRSKHHADGLFTSSYSKLLSQLTATNYLESLIPKRVNGDLMENQSPVKRHSDAVFTNKYSRYRKKMAAKKWLIAMLQGKRSVEEPSLLEVSFSPDSTSYPTAEDTMFHYIINQLTLVGHLFVYIHDMIEKQGPIPETMVIYATQLSCFRADYV
uniref:Glucagon / GIP / secretin / VIP family domain-containing protein n=1 Tax=Lates calcarifer TaxID=8187 RepID=A0A4W6DHG0_LATCA